ncbi:MAG: rhodanese-like domain-containing protein [Chloroflexota bacterium]|nr:rhodanese-like domain-containing protein [Chloroflexota bacterium]
MLRRVLAQAALIIAIMLLTTIFQPLHYLQTMAQGQPACTAFKETGKSLCGKFLQYWLAHGGLPQQGFPITNEFTEISDLNGQSYTVQYFERAVFEAHPENQPPYDVLLSQLGTFRFQAKYNSVDPAPPPPTIAPPQPTTQPTAQPTAQATATTAVADDTPPRMTLADFKLLYDNPAKRPLIIDVRGKEFYDAGHIKGAISFPEADVDARVSELPKNKLIIAYCQ